MVGDVGDVGVVVVVCLRPRSVRCVDLRAVSVQCWLLLLLLLV